MSSGWMMAGLVAGLCAAGAGPALAAPVAVPDPAAAMLRIAAKPFRYGGALQGTVPGLQTAADGRPIHLSIGLDAAAPDGRLLGEAILFTTDRRLVALADVSGRVQAGPTPGTGACTLRLGLPGQSVTLSGICTADTLSGEIISRPRRLGLLTRMVSWWGDRAVSGRYWLTPASFDPGREDRSPGA